MFSGIRITSSSSITEGAAVEADTVAGAWVAGAIAWDTGLRGMAENTRYFLIK